MRAQEIEVWARDVVEAVTQKQPVEDTRIELKATWIEAEKAARQLAGQANAARGAPILWLIGVDERNASVIGVDPMEFEGWLKQIQSWFDGYAPELVTHINIRIGSATVAALYFETERYAPYVVTNAKGGYPEFSVPWRDGTRLRAARREELLRLLLPIIKQPQIRLATAGLSMTVGMDLPSLSVKHKHHWTFNGLVYITPAGGDRVVIPYAMCAIWMRVEGYAESAYRLPAQFGPTNPDVHKPQERKSMKLMGKEFDVTPPPPRESFTVKCGDTELLADGPGSARLTGNGYILRADPSVPTGNAFVTIEITPSGSDRKISKEATLRPVKKDLGMSIVHEWKA